MTGTELGEKLLLSVRQMKANQGTVVYSPTITARQKSGLSQSPASTMRITAGLPTSPES